MLCFSLLHPIWLSPQPLPSDKCLARGKPLSSPFEITGFLALQGIKNRLSMTVEKGENPVLLWERLCKVNAGGQTFAAVTWLVLRFGKAAPHSISLQAFLGVQPKVNIDVAKFLSLSPLPPPLRRVSDMSMYTAVFVVTLS